MAAEDEVLFPVRADHIKIGSGDPSDRMTSSFDEAKLGLFEGAELRRMAVIFISLKGLNLICLAWWGQCESILIHKCKRLASIFNIQRKIEAQTFSNHYR